MTAPTTKPDVRAPADPLAAAADTWQMLSGLFEATRLMPQKLRAADGSLPLTVIGGFLGAGKTTLLNRLLSAPHGRRLAVLVNDFGRINIDASLVRSRTEQMISLTNGCACCSVAGDLTRTLIELAQQDEPPQAIVLEASGLADPRGIVQVALANPALRLDGIVVVLDAETLIERAGEPACAATVASQLASADVAVLNKVDLAGPAQLAAVREWLAQHAPRLPTIEATQAEVPIDVLLEPRHPQHPLSGYAPVAADHAAGFASRSFEFDAPFDEPRLRTLLGDLPPGILRAKGMLRLAGDAHGRMVYQRVGTRWSLTRDLDSDAAPAQSQLVFIGLAGSFDADALGQRIEAALAR